MKKFLFLISFILPIKTNNHGWLTYYGKKRKVQYLKTNFGYRIGDTDARNGIDNNPFTDPDKWNGYDVAQYDNWGMKVINNQFY